MDNVGHIGIVVNRNTTLVGLHDFLQVLNELDGELAEVDDKVERVLNLVGYACTEHA